MRQAYQPLHHKYRPERFDDLIGQEPISAALTQAIESNRIAPAYLFSGPRGTGKTSSARILARSLNCLNSQGPTPQPCGKCDLCKNIALGTALDVIEIDAASNTGVDNIRELIERSRFAPVQARWKVYVIDECHMLSTAAFNALLKTLEEPPRKVVFILATTDPQRVLSTIVSRCQCFDFRRIALNSLTNHLKVIADKENISIEKNALHLIAQRSEGGLRDAESMLDQLSLLPQPINVESIWELLGEVPEEELLKMTYALLEANPIKLLETSRNLLNQGKEPLSILQGLASILRDLVVLNSAPERPELTNISIDSREQLTKLANRCEKNQLLNWQSELKGTEFQLRQSAQPRLWLEILILGLLSEKSSQKYATNNFSNKPPINNTNSSVKPISSKELKINNDSEENKNPEHHDPVLKKNNSLQNLTETWQQILGSLELPSTRMLLNQQAKLVRLTEDKAFIQVAENWVSMVQSRTNILEQAINKALGSPRQLVIETQRDPIKASQRIEVKDSPNIIEKQKSLESSDTITKKLESNTLANSSPPKNDSKATKEEEKSVDSQAKNLADFFNGQVLDVEI